MHLLWFFHKNRARFRHSLDLIEGRKRSSSSCNKYILPTKLHGNAIRTDYIGVWKKVNKIRRDYIT